MSRYIDKIIRGERTFNEFWEKFRPGQKLEWLENFAHCGEITVENIWAYLPDGSCACFRWMYMPSRDPSKGFWDITQRRHEIYEGIRTGKITGEV